MKELTTNNVRALGACLLLGALVAACAGGSERGGDEAGVGPLPEGYAIALDRANRDPTDFVVTDGPDGLRVRTGPAGLLYRPADQVEAGPYRVSAAFTQVAAPRGHREGYGLFIGGWDLRGPDQQYTYFLVRGDGRYLVKARSGYAVHNLSDDWVASPAVVQAGDGDTTNALRIHVAENRITFHCNDVQVAEVPAEGVARYGVAGIRVNHNLNVVVRDFRIER